MAWTVTKAPRDTKIKAEDPTTNYGYDAYLETDGSPQEATLLGWDVSAMQPGTVVQSASITMYVTNRSGEEYGLFQLLQDWREDEATWEQYSDSGSWQSEGILGSADAEFQSMADFTPESLGSITVDLNAVGVATIQSWIDNPSTNRGMLVQGYDARNGAAFSSRETGDVDRRPQLSITFEDDDTPPIDPANLAPVVDAGEDQTVTEGTNVWLVADVEDDGIPSSIVAVQWSVVSGPGSVVFSGENSLQTAASISTPGTYVLELTADDGQLTSSDTVTIEVLEQSVDPINLAPTVDAGASQTITAGAAAQLQATVDDDGLPNSTLGIQWTARQWAWSGGVCQRQQLDHQRVDDHGWHVRA